MFKESMKQEVAQQAQENKPKRKQGTIMRPINACGRNSVGRVSASQAECRLRLKPQQIEFEIKGFFNRKKLGELARDLFADHKSNTGHLNQKSLEKSFHSVAGVSATTNARNLMHKKKRQTRSLSGSSGKTWVGLIF